MITLCEIERTVVTQPFQMRFNSHPRVVGRTLCAAIEVDIELNFKPPDIFFKPRQAILNSRLFVDSGCLVLLAPFSSQPGKLVIFYGQGRNSNRAAQAGSP